MGNGPAGASSSNFSEQSAEQQQENLLFLGQGQAIGEGVPSNREAFRESYLKRFEERAEQQKQQEQKQQEQVEESLPLLEEQHQKSSESNSSPDPAVSVSAAAVISPLSEHVLDPTGFDKIEAFSVANNVDSSLASVSESMITAVPHQPGSSDTKTQAEEKQNILMEAIFACSLSPNETALKAMVVSNPALYRSGAAIFLESLAKEIKAESPSSQPFLNANRVEQILLHGVALFFRSGSPLSLNWLADCYSRCVESFIGSNMLSLKIWVSLGKTSSSCDSHSVHNEFNFENMREMIIRHAALSLQCPDYFTIADDPRSITPAIGFPSATAAITAFIPTANTNTLQQFLSKLFDEVSQNNAEDLESLLTEVIGAIAKALQTRQMNDLHKPVVAGLQHLLTVKAVPSLVRSHPSFFGFDATRSDQSKPVDAFVLQHSSMLGHLLRPTSMDETEFVQDRSQSTRQRLFGNIFLRPVSVVSQASAVLAQELSEVVSASSAVVTFLCRGSDVSGRTDTLTWFATVLNSNGVRHQQGLQMQLDLMSSIPIAEAFALRSQGLSTDGFNLNVFWVLLKLLEPVKLQKVCDLDPFFVLREDSIPLMGDYLKEGRFADSDEIKKITEAYSTRSESSIPPKFPTQLLWLTFRSLRSLFCPAVKSYDFLIRKIEELQRLQRGGQAASSDSRYEMAAGKLLCVQAVFHHANFISSWWNFCHLTLSFFARIFLSLDCNGKPKSDMEELAASKQYKYSTLLNQFTGDSPPPPQLQVLPLAILDDLMEAVTFFASLPVGFDSRGVTNVVASALGESTTLMDVELVAAVTLFIMRSSVLIKNPHTRWSSGSQPFFAVYFNPRFHSRLDSSSGVIQWLIPSVIASFIDTQKAGYYGRIEQRLIYTRILEKALATGHHAQRLKAYATSDEHRELFIRFLAMLVESMTWLLEEAMRSLAEIKTREPSITAEGQPADISASANSLETAANPGQQERRPSSNANEPDSSQDDFDPRTTEEGQNVSEMRFEQLEQLCQSLMDGGLRAIKVMSFVSKICGDFIVSSSLLLTQVTTSLDCCLEHLVGQRCLQLKVSNFDKYNFNPRQLLASICEIYNHLERADGKSGLTLAAICADTRYFKPAVFIKAHKIAAREGLLSSRDLQSFNELTKSLQEKATEVEKEEQWLSEIWDTVPDEYKDPIMDELMSDPVKLPTSGQIMDRKHIERHLTTEEFDPFNRMLLKKDQLIPQLGLQQKIQDFVDQLRLQKNQQQEKE